MHALRPNVDDNGGEPLDHRGNAKGLAIMKIRRLLLAAALGLAAFAAQAADPIKVGLSGGRGT